MIEFAGYSVQYYCILTALGALMLDFDALNRVPNILFGTDRSNRIKFLSLQREQQENLTVVLGDFGYAMIRRNINDSSIDMQTHHENLLC